MPLLSYGVTLGCALICVGTTTSAPASVDSTPSNLSIEGPGPSGFQSKVDRGFVAGTRIMVGSTMAPIEISGLGDIHLSDWQTFGTGAAEGRIALDLADGNTDGFDLGFGARVSAEWDLHFEGVTLTPSIDVGLLFTNATIVDAGIGAQAFFLQAESWRLGAGLSVGAIIGSMHLGDVKRLPGKDPLVLTEQGGVREGQDLNAELTGFRSEVSVTFDWSLHELIGMPIGLRLQGGFRYAILPSFKVASNGGVEFEKESAALVKNDGSTEQANLDPSASSIGPVATIGVTWML